MYSVSSTHTLLVDLYIGSIDAFPVCIKDGVKTLRNYSNLMRQGGYVGGAVWVVVLLLVLLDPPSAELEIFQLLPEVRTT